MSSKRKSGQEEELPPTAKGKEKAKFSDQDKGKPKPKREKKETSGTLDMGETGAFDLAEFGWTTASPSLLYKVDEAAEESAHSIAAFGLDGTLMTTKKGHLRPASPKDWELFNHSVPSVLREYVDTGYKIVVFSNQDEIKKKHDGKAGEKMVKLWENIAERLREEGVPVSVFYATSEGDCRMPNRALWDLFVEKGNGGAQPDLNKSFFVGAQAGRPTDRTDYDRKFAAAIGIEFKTPEEVFGEGEHKKQMLAPMKPGASNEPPTGANKEMAEAFLELAEKTREAGGNQFEINSYKKSARIIASYTKKITDSSELAGVQGIGKGTKAKIDQFLETGKIWKEEKPDKKPKKEAPPTEAAKMAGKFLD